MTDQTPIELRKFLAGAVTVKMTDTGDAEVEAVLSETGVVDLDYDMILPGAFDDAIQAKAEPDMLYMHRRGDIIGRWAGLRMDGAKLKARGTLYNGSEGFELARQAFRLAKTGQLAGVSIGFRVLEWKNVRDEKRPYGWDISKLELGEASLVDRPANESAEITEIKRKLHAAGAPGVGGVLAELRETLSRI